MWSWTLPEEEMNLVRFQEVAPKSYMDVDAAGMVLRPALNTGFSEMGWGSTPPASAKVKQSLTETGI